MFVDISPRLKFLIESVSGGNASDFANKSGIKAGTLHNYIKGRAPSAESLVAICENLGVDLNWLLTGQGEPFLTATPPAAQPKANSELAALIGMTAEILQSGTDYADSLAANIKSFHKSVEMERQLAARDDRGAADTADRLEKLERMCEEIKTKIETRVDEALGHPAKVAAGGG